MSLCPNETVLKIFGHEGEKANDILHQLVTHGTGRNLALLFWSPSTQRWTSCKPDLLFCNVCSRLANFVSIKRNEKETFLQMDRSKIKTVGKPAIDDFLLRIQVYKATANYDAAFEMYEKYTNVNETFQKLRKK